MYRYDAIDKVLYLEPRVTGDFRAFLSTATAYGTVGVRAGKPFFEGLIDFITGGPVVVGVLEGNEAISVVRSMLGATNGTAAAPGTIRGDFSISKQNNLVHGSDSEESAKREIALWFKPGEVVDYKVAGGEWVFDGA